MRPVPVRRGGFTLMELIVALVIMGLGLGVVTAALTSVALRDPPNDFQARLSRSRSTAVSGGEAVVVWPDSAYLGSSVLFLPDGRVVGPAGTDAVSGSIGS